MNIPDSFFKYKSSEQQIEAESSERFHVLEFGTDIYGECPFIKIDGGMFPYKNWVLPNTLFSANMVKSMIAESLKIISKWYFIPALILVDKQLVLDCFNRIVFRICSDKIFKDKHWSKFAKAFHFVIFDFLWRCGFEEKSADRFAEIFVFLIDMDNAYRLRLADIFSASSRRQLMENPRKEVKRILKIINERELCPVVNKKFIRIENLLSIFLLIPKVKRSFIDAIKNCDYSNLESDYGDKYWQTMRTDFCFGGMNYQERQELAKKKGWTFPKQIGDDINYLIIINNMENKTINGAQIQLVLNALQKANVGIQDYIAIQTMFQQLPAELPKIPEQIVEEKK